MTHGAPAPYYIVGHDNLPEYLPYEVTKEFVFGDKVLTLPALKINKDTVIYVLNIMGGQPEDIQWYAENLSNGFYRTYKIDYDGFISAEGKSIPLVYEIAFQETLPYTILRKSCKPYMGEKVLSARVKSTTTPDQQELYLDNKDLVNILNKRLMFVDDVITTGATLNACEKIVSMAGGKIVGVVAMALEGSYEPSIPTYFLCRLPIIKLSLEQDL